MKNHCLWLLLMMSAAACADQTPADEIAARSGLPASEVGALLNNCDSSQTSMNFCAWRDQIVAERELQQVVDKQVGEHPERKTALEAKIAKWKRARDASCEKSARKEWGDGSMRPAAQATCATAVTKKMTKRLSATVTRPPS
ncbi:lysozyme inhibitor LprI family protein [Burkholderia cenocepacia]|uniref:lysozyme inhibitor LprI family protein n=1 Tax=Burkholderia cenocepacia TaxID=95486 RepID=UPI002ABE3993|nr:lysozyme inhibitor LprI family protein [Burkholderia cenocepacia]